VLYSVIYALGGIIKWVVLFTHKFSMLMCCDTNDRVGQLTKEAMVQCLPNSLYVKSQKVELSFAPSAVHLV